MSPTDPSDGQRIPDDEAEQILKSMQVVDDYLRQWDCANTDDILLIHELVHHHGNAKHRAAYDRLYQSALIVYEIVVKRLTGEM